MKFTMLAMLHETAVLELAYGLRPGAARPEPKNPSTTLELRFTDYGPLTPDREDTAPWSRRSPGP